MITITPDYYKRFHCIAGACRHTCCAGWEVDIDEESMARYEADGLKEISREGGTPHFVLTPDERCPYLNEKNLCRLILKKGEGYLCQICTDHPRFRNFWTGVTEVGLGLVCEEAARIILSEKTPMRFAAEAADGEYGREKIRVLLPEDEQYLWDVREELFREAAAIRDPMEARLTEYFIFRHIADALYDDRLEERIQLVNFCVETVTARWTEAKAETPEERAEIARAFSDEFEYDEEKKEELLAQFRF